MYYLLTSEEFSFISLAVGLQGKVFFPFLACFEMPNSVFVTGYSSWFRSNCLLLTASACNYPKSGFLISFIIGKCGL